MGTRSKSLPLLEEVPRVNQIANKQLAHLIQSTFLRNLKRCLVSLLIPLVISGLLVIQPESTYAASGGRIGGGSFRAPSMPRTGGYGGGYRGGYGGGYRGGYGGGYRRGYGGGIGFPFLIPIFGFGGGGLFGFLILMSIAGVLVNALRGAAPTLNASTPNYLNQKPEGPVNILQVQMGLLASAKEIQTDLRQLASNANTSSMEGLKEVLQQTTLALLRQPELWVYGNIEKGEVPFQAAETTFNRLSMTERSKLKSELTTNFSGKKTTLAKSETLVGEADQTNEYIVITLLMASRGRLNLGKSTSTEQLKNDLRVFGSISSNDLIALEVIWQPEGKGEVLTREELVTSYPNLQYL